MPKITPFRAGLLELQPWLYRWRHDFDPMYSGSPADFFAGYRRRIPGERGLTDRQPAGMASDCGRSRRNCWAVPSFMASGTVPSLWWGGLCDERATSVNDHEQVALGKVLDRAADGHTRDAVLACHLQLRRHFDAWREGTRGNLRLDVLRNLLPYQFRPMVVDPVASVLEGHVETVWDW